LTGIRVFESRIFARATTVRRIGKLRTSTDVSFTNILIAITMDVWLDAKDTDLHYISHILPTLDWSGGYLETAHR